MEAWRYSALNTQFLNLQQKLLSTMQTSKDNNSASIEPMDSDFYNNSISSLKTGAKRQAADELQNEISQEKFVKKEERPRGTWTTNSCLKLDVYTQTEFSHVTDSYNKSLSYVSDMVQANSKKLENIEKFLERLGGKIEVYLTASEPGSELNKAKKHKENLMSLRYPLASEADSGVSVSTASVAGGSPRDTNVLADSTKSPSLCLSPGLCPLTLRTDSPGVVNNSVNWSQGFQQGLDPTGKPIQQGMQSRFMTSSPGGTEPAARPFVLEGKLEALSRGLERDELGAADTNVIVPVIISLGDKSKKNITTEIPLQDIINGAPCLLEGFQHLRYSQGCWFGDRTNPLSRVWFCGDTKLLRRAEASGSNPAKLSLNLLEALFSRAEMAASNINGARGRELLNPIKIKAIQAHINYKFPIEPDKEEMRWRFIKPRIDSKCRAQRRMQREQQAKLESSPRTENSERMFRSRVPRLDHREKDKLLYGYSRSAELYLSTSEPQDGGDSFQGTRTAVDDSHPVQLETNEAIVEITGTSVTVE